MRHLHPALPDGCADNRRWGDGPQSRTLHRLRPVREHLSDRLDGHGAQARQRVAIDPKEHHGCVPAPGTAPRPPVSGEDGGSAGTLKDRRGDCASNRLRIDRMETFTYKGNTYSTRIILQYFGIVGILFFTGFAIFIVAGIRTIPTTTQDITLVDDPKATLVCLAIWILLITWGLGAMLINFLPTVWMDDDGLLISTFMFFRIKIPWNKIIDIGKANAPKGYTLIRTRNISAFHYLYGWFYSHSFYPSFLIQEDIDKYEYLVEKIRQKIRDKN